MRKPHPKLALRSFPFVSLLAPNEASKTGHHWSVARGFSKLISKTRNHPAATAEDGAVAVEFAVILPLFIGLILTAVSASLHFATTSDLQQLAHELARSSLRYAPDSGWCDALTTDWLTRFAANLPMLNPPDIQSVQCDYDVASGIAEVSVTYDAANSAGSILGRLVGLDMGTIARQSFVRL